MRAGQRLIIMVKEPRMGAVKTRLARDVGPVAATQFYRTVSSNLVRRLGRDPRWRTILAVTPDRAAGSAWWPDSADRARQGGGDLGMRMERLLAAQAPHRAVLIGSDIPGVRRAFIAQAFDALKHNDAVFGPALDGGFWLVGINPLRRPKGLFRSVRWSSRHTLDDTLRNLAGRRVGLAATLGDVDEGGSLALNGPSGRTVTGL